MTFKYNFILKAAEISKDKSCAIWNENPSWVPEAPRKGAVARLRLLTEHDCVRSHLYRIGIADSPDCILCDSGQPMVTERLDVCPTLKGFNQWRNAEY
ncbi:hypothetical protein TNCV_2102381 [Trichonephila clavipes]|nr:hypothetical protein TNCV_2102381 [Trichonephila clavipes]